MLSIYNFVSGPLVWVAFIVFVGGCLWRLVSMAMLAREKDVFVYEYASFHHALRSIVHWLVPFGTVNMRRNPAMTVATFAFHICLIVSPLFLFAHIALFRESWGVSWGYLSDGAADIMTLIVIAACVFFLVRRLILPETRYLTSASDFVLLALVAAPFVTGFWTYHQLAGFRVMGILHILSGEIMLAAIPFTRLSHMIFFLFTRGYMGSEFGAVRHARDW
jgi:nitrate reductase gamma subunit